MFRSTDQTRDLRAELRQVRRVVAKFSDVRKCRFERPKIRSSEPALALILEPLTRRFWEEGVSNTYKSISYQLPTLWEWCGSWDSQPTPNALGATFPFAFNPLTPKLPGSPVCQHFDLVYRSCSLASSPKRTHFLTRRSRLLCGTAFSPSLKVKQLDRLLQCF